MSMDVLCVSLHYIHTSCLQRQNHPGTGVMDGQSTRGYWEQNLDRLEEQRVSLITEIFLQPLVLLFIDHYYGYMCHIHVWKSGLKDWLSLSTCLLSGDGIQVPRLAWQCLYTLSSLSLLPRCYLKQIGEEMYQW